MLTRQNIVNQYQSYQQSIFVNNGKIDYRSKATVGRRNAFVDYYNNVRGLDIFSRVIIPSNSQQKVENKWQRKIGELFVETAICNAFFAFQKKSLNYSVKVSTKLLLMYHLHGAPALKVGGGDPLYNRLSFTTY